MPLSVIMIRHNVRLNERHFIARSLFIMSKFYVFVLCVRVHVNIAQTVFSLIMLCASFLCKHVRLSRVFYKKLT